MYPPIFLILSTANLITLMYRLLSNQESIFLVRPHNICYLNQLEDIQNWFFLLLMLLSTNVWTLGSCNYVLIIQILAQISSCNAILYSVMGHNNSRVLLQTLSRHNVLRSAALFILINQYLATHQPKWKYPFWLTNVHVS